MGGIYGNAAATALEDCPAPARGLISGMLQQGVSRTSKLPSATAITPTLPMRSPAEQT